MPFLKHIPDLTLINNYFALLKIMTWYSLKLSSMTTVPNKICTPF